MKKYALPAIVLLAVVVRIPFWVEALRTPLDGDSAIIGLMARHPLASATMWGQPYGSPVEAWLALPVLHAFGFTPAALRLVYFLLGLALVPAGAWLARQVDPKCALPVAFLLACPSPYFLLLSALPPPLYPTALLLATLLIGVTLTLVRASERALPPGRVAPWLWGGLAGLSLWTHLMTASVVAASGLYLLRRSRSARLWIPAALALLAASAPLWMRAVRDPGALRIVSLSDRQEGTMEHLRALLPEIHRPITGLLGAHVPWVADDADFVVFAPTAIAFALVAVHGLLLVGAIAGGATRGAPGLLLGVVVLASAAFPLPVRAGPNAIRFLSVAYVPLVCLVCWVAAVKGNPRRAFIVALALAGLNLTVGVRLLQAWRTADRAQAPFLLPDLRPLRQALDERGIRRVYTSYGPAYRLTFESGERIVATQPWNERFLHYPMPYLDEVRFAHGVAWVLLPRVPSDLPAPALFVERLGAAGGRWARVDAGGAIVFHDFAPPFAPDVRRLDSAGAAGDGRLDTTIGVDALRGGPSVTWTVEPPRPLAAVTLVAALSGPRLPRGLDLEVSADGVAFERVVRRRRREERGDLRWVNGHPQFVIDDDLVAAPLGGRTVAAVRLTPVGPDPWAIGEVLTHEVAPSAAGGEPWGEWLDPHLDWPARRRALEGSPRPDREDWYYRRLLAERHP
jgi:hypothetical protein